MIEYKKKSEPKRIINQPLVFFVFLFLLFFFTHPMLWLLLLVLFPPPSLSLSLPIVKTIFIPNMHACAVARASKRNYHDTIIIDQYKAKARTAYSSRTNWCVCECRCVHRDISAWNLICIHRFSKEQQKEFNDNLASISRFILPVRFTSFIRSIEISLLYLE